MTDRSDIEPNGRGWRRLSYTRRCGWVDWGHALPGNPLSLKRQLEAERATWPGLSRLVVRANGQPVMTVPAVSPTGSLQPIDVALPPGTTEIEIEVENISPSSGAIWKNLRIDPN